MDEQNWRYSLFPKLDPQLTVASVLMEPIALVAECRYVGDARIVAPSVGVNTTSGLNRSNTRKAIEFIVLD